MPFLIPTALWPVEPDPTRTSRGELHCPSRPSFRDDGKAQPVNREGLQLEFCYRQNPDRKATYTLGKEPIRLLAASGLTSPLFLTSPTAAFGILAGDGIFLPVVTTRAPSSPARP